MPRSRKPNPSADVTAAEGTHAKPRVSLFEPRLRQPLSANLDLTAIETLRKTCKQASKSFDNSFVQLNRRQTLEQMQQRLDMLGVTLPTDFDIDTLVATGTYQFRSLASIERSIKRMQYHQYQDLFHITNAWIYLIFAIPPQLPGVNLYTHLALDFFNVSLAEYLFTQPGCTPNKTVRHIVNRAALAGSSVIIKHYIKINAQANTFRVTGTEYAKPDINQINQWLILVASSGNLDLMNWLTATEQGPVSLLKPHQVVYSTSHSLESAPQPKRQAVESLAGLKKLLELFPDIKEYQLYESETDISTSLAKLGDVEILEWIKSQAPADKPINPSKEVLDIAAFYGKTEMVQWLCDVKRGEYACQPDQDTLDQAARSGNKQLYDFVLSRLKDGCPNTTTFNRVVASGNLELAQHIYSTFDASTDMNTLMQNSLSHAIASRQLPMVQWFIEPDDKTQFPHQCTPNNTHIREVLYTKSFPIVAWLTDENRHGKRLIIDFSNPDIKDQIYNSLYSQQLWRRCIHCQNFDWIAFIARQGLLTEIINTGSEKTFTFINTQLMICLWDSLATLNINISRLISRFGPRQPDAVTLLEYVTTHKKPYHPPQALLSHCLKYDNLKAAKWLIAPNRGANQMHLSVVQALDVKTNPNVQLSQETINFLESYLQESSPINSAGGGCKP